MLRRIEKDTPEFFEERGMPKNEMAVYLVNNICLPYAKQEAKVFREATTRIKEKEYLKDSIRRLSNQGDRFHPYI